MRFRYHTAAILTALALVAGGGWACADSTGLANQAENQNGDTNDGEGDNEDNANGSDSNANTNPNANDNSGANGGDNGWEPDEDPPAASNEVFLSEFMKAPTEVDVEEGQWIELYNSTDQTFDLYGCSITTSVADPVEIEESLEIGAGEMVTIASGENPGFSPDLVLEDLELARGEGYLDLKCNDSTITYLYYDAGEYYPGAEGVSVARDADLFDPEEDPEQPWLWCEGTGQYNGDDVGRPGEMPESCPGIDESSADDIEAVRSAVAGEYEGDSGQEVTFEDTTLEQVLVTYVRSEIGDDPAGFYVQAAQEGPALFVPVEDVENAGDLPVRAGQVIDLEVEAADLLASGTFVTQTGDIEIVRQHFPPSMMTVDISDADDLRNNLDDYESRMISADMTIESEPTSAGLDFSGYEISTAGIGEEAGDSLLFRVPEYHVDNLGAETGCQFRIEDVPLGRFFDSARLSMWHLYETEIIECTPTEPVETRVLDENRVYVDFNRALGGVVNDGSQFSIEGLDVVGASYLYNEVLLETEEQTPGEDYTVEVDDSLSDYWDRQSGGAVEFTGFEPLEVVISEFMARYESGTQDAGEFVELHNPGDEEFDLEGCIFDRPGLDDELEIGGVTIPAGGEVLFASSQDADADLEVDEGLPFALLNSGGTFELRCDGEVLDRVTYQDHHVELGSSLQKDLDFTTTPNMGTDGEVGSIWCVTPPEDQFHYTDGADDGQPKYGTPGAENAVCP